MAAALVDPLVLDTANRGSEADRGGVISDLVGLFRQRDSCHLLGLHVGPSVAGSCGQRNGPAPAIQFRGIVIWHLCFSLYKADQNEPHVRMSGEADC